MNWLDDEAFARPRGDHNAHYDAVIRTAEECNFVIYLEIKLMPEKKAFLISFKTLSYEKSYLKSRRNI